MSILKLIGSSSEKTSLPSIIKDPFSKNKIVRIDMQFYNYSWCKTPYWKGTIVFEDGNTSGRQELQEVSTLDELLAQIKAIGESLNT